MARAGSSPPSKHSDHVPTTAGMRPADFDGLIVVEAPAVSPDGSTIAYVVRTMDVPADSYRSAIWLVPATGSAPARRLTDGDRDSAPTWTPDGRGLVYCSTRPDGHELRLLHLADGHSTSLAERNEPFESVTVAPNGSRLAFVSRVRAGRYERNGARRVDRLFPRKDGIGWTVDRPAQLFTLDLSGRPEGTHRSHPVQITSGRADVLSPAWSADSTRLAFVTARGPRADHAMVNELWVRDADGTEHPVPTLPAVHRAPSFSPDGRSLAVVQHSAPQGGRVGWRHGRLTLVDIDGGDRRILAPGLDRNCHAIGAFPAPLRDGDDLLVIAEDSGNTHLLRVSIGTGQVHVEVGGEIAVTGFHRAGGTTAVTAATPDRPSELFVLSDGAPVRITDHQQAFLDAHSPAPLERFTVVSEDGCDIDAWLVRPAGWRPGLRYPVLLSIHGGPQTQYGNWWFDEFQLWAGAGFAVVFCNPHGSSGKGEHFARSYLAPACPKEPGNGWGGIDFRDLMTVLDTALTTYDFLDGERAGVLGGSYGGLMTTWIISHTDRFVAACSERAVNSMLSMEGSSDMAGLISLETGLDPFQQTDELSAWSPFRYAAQINTPVLVLHSDNDLRCPVEQADALFVALTLLGKPVEYWRFPEGSHDLSRSGPPRLRVERAELIIEWFTRALGTATPSA